MFFTFPDTDPPQTEWVSYRVKLRTGSITHYIDVIEEGYKPRIISYMGHRWLTDRWPGYIASNLDSPAGPIAINYGGYSVGELERAIQPRKAAGIRGCPKCGDIGDFVRTSLVCPEHGPFGGF